MSKSFIDNAAKNETRSFPIHENASKLDVKGKRLPDNVFTSLRCKIPSNLESTVAIGGVSISEHLLNVILVAYRSGSVIPVASLSARQPIDVGVIYNATPLFPGVEARISFGNGAVYKGENEQWHFNYPQNTRIVQSESWSYPTPFTTSIQKENFNAGLNGFITLESAGDIIIEGADRAIDDIGTIERVIVLRIDRTKSSRILYEYAGPCAARPESDTCGFIPITQINGVRPDENGNITIDFTGLNFATNNNSVFLTYEKSMKDACAGKNAWARSANVGENLCT